ncbi:MAG: hypothetical protein MJZ11_05910 [Lachnospiraceae bacterium]|nr:hypothetical protein [Lachnospiraceae bacterium]
MIECPGCGGNLKFDIQKQLMHCSYCDNCYDPYDFDKKDSDGKIIEDYETTIYTCAECAGEIESTEESITGVCPFCGANTIFYSRISKELRPNYIIPFSVTKEECKANYMSAAKKSLFLPKEYKDIEYIDGFRGIYMPYWSYNVDEKGESYVMGEKTERHGDYIYHRHFKLSGDANTFYHGFTHDASSSFQDDISERIEPFDIKKKKDFTAGFLSGFYADTADVDSSVYHADVLNFARENTYKEIAKIKEFSKYSLEKKPAEDRINSVISKTDRTLFPVWFMSYRHNDRVAYATVNGQTGKVAADFPIDVKKYVGFSLVMSLIIFVFLNFFLVMKPSTLSIVSAIVGLVALITYLIEKKNIKDRDLNIYDRGLNRGKKRKKPEYTYDKKPILSCVAGITVSGIMFFSDTIYDYMHYGASLFTCIVTLIAVVYIIKDFNILATRRLPQFDKKGGDDNA